MAKRPVWPCQTGLATFVASVGDDHVEGAGAATTSIGAASGLKAAMGETLVYPSPPASRV
jgi:hypothetical protein